MCVCVCGDARGVMGSTAMSCHTGMGCRGVGGALRESWEKTLSDGQCWDCGVEMLLRVRERARVTWQS